MLGPIELGSDDSDEYLDAYQSDDEDGTKALDHEWKEILKEIEETKVEVFKKAKEFKPFTDLKDDFRLPGVHKDGGFPLDDPKVLGNYRQAFKDIAK